MAAPLPVRKPSRPAVGFSQRPPAGGVGAPGSPQAQAYEQLLAAADKRGDQGASSQLFGELIGGVDMGRADRVNGIYGDRLDQYVSSGASMLGGVQSAYKAQQARDAARRARSGGGGGGGNAPVRSTQNGTDPEYLWWLRYYNELDPRTGSNAGSAGGRGVV